MSKITTLKKLDYEGTCCEILNILSYYYFSEDKIILNVSMVGGYKNEWDIKGSTLKKRVEKITGILLDIIFPCPLDMYIFDLFIAESPGGNGTTLYKINVFGYFNG